MAHTDHPDGVRAVLITTSKIELPIDIKTCTATLNIDITAATAKVAITINAADITGNIPIDIKVATAKVAISITAGDVTGNIPINIAAKTMGNIGIDIKAQTVAQLNVNIAASAITMNVSVIGTATISITAQTVGIYLESEWEALAGNGKVYKVEAADCFFGYEVGEIKTIPAAETFVAHTLTGYCHAHRDAEADFNQFFSVRIALGVELIFRIGGNGGFALPINPPLKVAGGVEMTITISSWANHKTDMGAFIIGYQK